MQAPRPWLWLLFVVVWLLLPAVAPLMTPDEGRYAEIAREMIVSGDWITPHLNAYLYFEKPPLQYWLTALSFECFGLNEWAARLWPALAFLLSLGAIAFTARKVFGAAAASAAALVYASAIYPLVLGQVNTLDSGVGACLTLALCAFLLAFHDGATERERGRAMLLCWAAMALAVLSKGLIGLLIPGSVLVLYVLVTRQWNLLARLNWLAGLSLFLLIAAPWFVVVSLRNPDFAQFFFIHEHFQRYLTNEAHREGGWWYFLALLAFGALPWTLLLPATLRDALKDQASGFRPRLLLAIWVLFVLLFFSASQSKLPGYLTPLFPALALLLGERLARLPPASIRAATLTAGAFWLLLLAASFFADRMHSHSLTPDEIAQLAAHARSATLAGLLGAALAWAWRDRKPLVPLAAGSSAAVLLIIVGMTPYAYARSSRDLATAAADAFAAASQVYSIGVYDQTLPFYLRRPVRLVQFTGEFEFGQAHAPELFPDSWAAFLKEWQAQRRPVAVTSLARYRQLVDDGLPMTTLYSDLVDVVVTRP